MNWQTTNEYGYVTYTFGNAALDRAFAVDALCMVACIAVGAVALRLVQLWREDRRRAAKRRERQATAEIRRDCTGDPNTCTRAYSVPTDRETPICEVLGGECERTAAARR